MISDTLFEAIVDIEKQLPCYPPCHEVDAVRDLLDSMKKVRIMLDTPPMDA